MLSKKELQTWAEVLEILAGYDDLGLVTAYIRVHGNYPNRAVFSRFHKYFQTPGYASAYWNPLTNNDRVMMILFYIEANSGN